MDSSLNLVLLKVIFLFLAFLKGFFFFSRVLKQILVKDISLLSLLYVPSKACRRADSRTQLPHQKAKHCETPERLNTNAPLEPRVYEKSTYFETIQRTPQHNWKRTANLSITQTINNYFKKSTPEKEPIAKGSGKRHASKNNSRTFQNN